VKRLLQEIFAFEDEHHSERG